MTKPRVPIPRTVRTQVLAEFHGRCAICAADGPQLHHIDADPANNAPTNLIPLCPNCHLRDQHDPTRAVDPHQLRLFRVHRDPCILQPQFHPLFCRLRFLDDIHPDTPVSDLDAHVTELTDFVAALELGAFYSKRLLALLARPHWLHFSADDAQQEHADYRTHLAQARVGVQRLAVELLRYQRW